MTKKVNAIRGMNDILPEQVNQWQYVEAVIRELTASYGYQEIRFPILEQLGLFKRTIGEVTDIVEKEMYEFQDRNGDHLALRPEGTAGCVRAAIEHGLTYNQVQRLWYMGPMYRHERPQKCRYRQFYQLGLEAFGMPGPDIDAEIILWTQHLWQRLGIADDLELQINSLGNSEARNAHRQELVAFYNKHADILDEDSQRRLTTNPLRILDSKNPELQELNKNAPKLLDYLDPDSKQHFSQLCELLDAVGVKYTINPSIVRGLDYYNKTVFEWVTNSLGSQGTVCAGGRYDGLVAQLGGHDTPGIGFALGLERLLSLLDLHFPEGHFNSDPDAYMILVGDSAAQQGLKLSQELRQNFPLVKLITNCGGGSFKSQFKRADKSGAELAIIIGEDEIANQTVAIKFLRSDRPQENISLDHFTNFFESISKQN